MGHVFQGRYKAIIVQKHRYLLELSRYIVLNPVRAGIADHPENYPWSSYCATIGKHLCPGWLAADNLLSTFHDQRNEAVWRYRQYVREGVDPLFSGEILQQTYWGDKSFICEVRKHISRKQSDNIHITQRSKRSPKRPIEEIASAVSDRGAAMKVVYETGHYTMFEIAQHLNVHYSTLSRTIRSLYAQCND